MCQYNENDDEKYKYVYDEDCLEYFTPEEKYIPKVKGHDDNSSKVNDENVKTESYVPGTTYQELSIADDQVSSDQSNDHHPGFFQKTSTKVLFGIAIILPNPKIKIKRHKKGGKTFSDTSSSIFLEDPTLNITTTPQREINIMSQYISSTGTTTPTQEKLEKVSDYLTAQGVDTTTPSQNILEGTSEPQWESEPHQSPTQQGATSPRGRASSLEPIGRVPSHSQSGRSSSESNRRISSPSHEPPTDYRISHENLPPVIQQPHDYFPIGRVTIENPLEQGSQPPDTTGPMMPPTPLSRHSRRGRSRGAH
ncbi:3056_t:CDS:2 [Funneliformis caledonium]|uniref:3056_t:CDS:1 n=1 Tax=Funneliformis caledonium TaxID=1117310 RepID=A0A9N9AV12_9GLOM|nr:3056_t:CDS:2 [Funneliformis caledonium]